MGRFGHRRAVLEDISARLKHGAAALRAAAARDNAFFKEVVSLQRFWKVRSDLAEVLEGAPCPCSASLPDHDVSDNLAICIPVCWVALRHHPDLAWS